MPQVEKAILSNSTTLVINDYAGGPASLTITAVLAESFRTLLARTYAFGEVPINTSGGVDIWATPFIGLAPGQTFQVTHKLVDPKDNSSNDAVVSFFRAAAANDWSATGFSGFTFTNPQTGGGKGAFKILSTQRSVLGVSHVTTMPVICTAYAPANSNGSEDAVADLLIIAAITIA